MQESLERLGYPVSSARVGRVVDLELRSSDPVEARAVVETMCADLLANGLIESFEITIEGEA